MDFRLLYILLLHHTVNIYGQAHYAKIYRHGSENTGSGSTPPCNILEESFLPNYKGIGLSEWNGAEVQMSPAFRLPEETREEHRAAEIRVSPKIIEIYGQTEEKLEETLRTFCPLEKDADETPTGGPNGTYYDVVPEIRKVVDSGNSSNRIDVVIMGDGYVASERKKFFQDIDRFVQEMFEGVTLRSYLPLFNVWAIYVESRESGIGYDGPKDTPFKLYREKGQYRVIYPGDTAYSREVCRMTGQDACDYATIMGNDDYYGGSGGEFVVFTRSPQTGILLLRHESGHNFLNAGDEYDNSWAYYGVNSAQSVSNVGWSHWLSGEKKEERATWRLLEYPWSGLERPLNFPFVSDGQYSRWLLTLSVIGAETDDAIEFLMDGQPLPWKSTGNTDRVFYDWNGNEGFSQGSHTFTVQSNRSKTSQNIATMICSVVLHEMGDENEYHMDNNYISAYPTWDDKKGKTFRPTNAGCLMRNITYDQFCPVCREGLWIQFLSKLSLIDDISTTDSGNADGSKRVTLKTLQLGQFRPEQQQKVEGEYLEIKWFKDNVEQVDLRNKTEIIAPAPSNWHIVVRLETPEVRSDPDGILESAAGLAVVP